MKIPALEKLLRENVDACFNADGGFEPRIWLQNKCWPVIAAEVTEFFGEAWNGDAEFERLIYAVADIDGDDQADWDLAEYARDMFVRHAMHYINQYESDLVEYRNEQAAQSRD